MKKRVRRADPQDWGVLLRDAHPGYITWEQYQRNQKQLEDNRSDRGKSRGAAREGAALLQGIVLCGRCGHRMGLRYRDHTYYYRCQWAHRKYGSGGLCQYIRGEEVDAAVVKLLLKAMTPAQLSIALKALEDVEEQIKQIERHWKLRIERAEYEADLARRRYMAVEPENRLVARLLEKGWNEKLKEAARLKREYAAAERPARWVVGAEEHSRILKLAQDFPAVWGAETTGNGERKQLLRYLIKDVTLTRREESIHLGVRWQTGAANELEIPRRKRIDELWRTPKDVIARIRTLAAHQTDRQTAAQLNAEGLRTGVGHTFDRERVRRVRLKYNIPASCPEMPDPREAAPRGDGSYSVRAAAKLLNVSIGTINNWCRCGKLESVQAVPGSPRWITLTPDIIARLRKPRRQTHRKRASVT
jgi:hypothetical protein